MHLNTPPEVVIFGLYCKLNSCSYKDKIKILWRNASYFLNCEFWECLSFLSIVQSSQHYLQRLSQKKQPISYVSFMGKLLWEHMIKDTQDSA